MSNIGTFAGGKLYIGTTLAIPFDQGEEAAIEAFEADSYTEIGGLNNMGEFGANANIVQFPLVSDDYVTKSKGTRDAGDPAVVCGRLSDDPGQILLRSGERTRFYYNFKLVLADAVDLNHTDTVIYMRGMIGGTPIQTGGNEDFVTETYTLALYPGPIIIESEEITSPSP